MKVQGIAVSSNPNVKYNVSNELLAAVLARYSRSNEGIEKIMSQVDNSDHEKSVDRIFKFIDYGHASIGALTGGIAIAIDNVSMWLAYKLFEICQLADGQESSTRYIKMDESSLPSAHDIGIPEDLAPAWNDLLSRCFKAYHDESEKLSKLAQEEPERIRLPSDPTKLLIERLTKNYSLDRARYFIPFATRTNVALVQNGRVWGQTIKYLSSMPQKEAQTLASLLREELHKFSPRQVKHSFPESSFINECASELSTSCHLVSCKLSHTCQPDNPWISVHKNTPPWLPPQQTIEQSLQHRINRYSLCGSTVRRMQLSFGWENIAVAELRDLNRHRTGHRYSPLIQTGIYTPPEINRDSHLQLFEDQTKLLRELVDRQSPAYVYCLLLGSQTHFEHSTHVDKFIYEVELRTGLGAHFRYAEHLKNVLHKFYELVPECNGFIKVGSAEPE